MVSSAPVCYRGARRTRTAGNLGLNAIRRKQSTTVVRAVKPDFVQELLQQGEGQLSIELGSRPNTARTSGDGQSGGEWVENY